MPTVVNAETLSTLEMRIKQANQAIQFNSIKRDLTELGARLERAPSLDRARYYFLKGILHTKASLLDRSDVRRWVGSSAEALAYATDQFADCIKTASAVRSAGTDMATLTQITLLERVATYEWAVAYTALRACKEDIKQESILGMECLGPDSQRRIMKALARGGRIESKFYRL